MLKGKFAVITGASEGIGFGIAKAFIENNANVLIIGRHAQKLNEAKSALAEFGNSVHTISGDLSDSFVLKKISTQILEQWPKIDILINNAGLAKFTPFENCEEQELDQHINLNFKAPFILTQSLLPSLLQQRGSVINISSYFARRMLTDRPSSAYSGTKGAIESWTKALAFELGQQGLRVNTIAPGTIDTPMMQRNMAALNDEQRTRFLTRIKNLYPLGHLGKIEDVARMAVFLASDQAEWITGANMVVDGGLTTH